MKNIVNSYFLMGTLLIGLSSSAAPMPATGTSLLTDPQKGLQFIKHRIHLDLTQTAWTLKENDSPSNIVALDFIPKTPQVLTPTSQLSLRLDNLKKDNAFDDYIKRSMKEYPQFGFSVLGSQKLNLQGQSVFVVDLSQRKKRQQLRQVIFMENKRVAVFTCLDEEANFKATLVECNKLVQTFRWKN